MPGASKLPGPGEHAPDFKSIKTASPRFGFGSEKRASPINEKLAAMPGPGNYKLPNIHENLSYSMGIKLKGSMDTNSISPGAGTYEPDIYKSKKREPQYKLGTSTRQDLEFETKKKF